MNKVLFQIPAMVDNIRTMKDKTLRITVYTIRELTPDEELNIFKLNQKEGWMVFSEAEVETSDIPDEPIPEFKGDKSPSKKLRDRMYVYYKKTYNKTEGFDEWYSSRLDKIGSQYLEKVED